MQYIQSFVLRCALALYIVSDARALVVRLQAVVVVLGKFNLRADAASCRRSCAVTEKCSAWVHCWEPSGCDDGNDIRPDVYPAQVGKSPLVSSGPALTGGFYLDAWSRSIMLSMRSSFAPDANADQLACLDLSLTLGAVSCS